MFCRSATSLQPYTLLLISFMTENSRRLRRLASCGLEGARPALTRLLSNRALHHRFTHRATTAFARC
jgi:hypothetical protein